MGSFGRNEGKKPGMGGGWYLLKTTAMRNSATENTVSKDIMEKCAIKGFNLILKIAGSEENGLTISSIDYTSFCSRETFNKDSHTHPFILGVGMDGGVNVHLFAPHIHNHT